MTDIDLLRIISIPIPDHDEAAQVRRAIRAVRAAQERLICAIRLEFDA